jgi:hypothetical protein
MTKKFFFNKFNASALLAIICALHISPIMAQDTYIEIDLSQNENAVYKLTTDGTEKGLFFELSTDSADTLPTVTITSDPDENICTLESIEAMGSTELLGAGRIIYHYGVFIGLQVVTDSASCLIEAKDETGKLLATIQYSYAI